MALNAFCRWRHKITKKIPYLQALQDFFFEKMHFCTYSLLEASYDSIVFDWISTVVSPRWRYELLVVTVRVTLQELRAIATTPAKQMNSFLIVVLF